MGTQRQDAWIGLALFVAGAMLALIISSAAPRAQGSASLGVLIRVTGATAARVRYRRAVAPRACPLPDK